MSSLAEAASAVGTTIGRYFSVVSMLPSTAAVGWIAVLVGGGAGRGDFQLAKAWQAAEDVTIGEIAVLIAVALVVSLLLNPFQFAATQLLEGYWGGSSLGAAVAASRINRHRRAQRQIIGRRTKARRMLQGLAKAHDTTVRGLLLGEGGDKAVYFQFIVDSLEYEDSQLPESARILPTRLGNALRSFEDSAGQEYGLDALKMGGHLSLLPSNERSAYVRDTRESLDLSIRLCMVFLVSTPITGLLLATEGWWALLAVVPYLAAYLSYRGAVLAAVGYGNAVRFQIDMDRFALYDALRIIPPANTARERQQNTELMSLLSRDPGTWSAVSVPYRSNTPGASVGLTPGRSRSRR